MRRLLERSFFIEMWRHWRATRRKGKTRNQSILCLCSWCFQKRFLLALLFLHFFISLLYFNVLLFIFVFVFLYKFVAFGHTNLLWDEAGPLPYASIRPFEVCFQLLDARVSSDCFPDLWLGFLGWFFSFSFGFGIGLGRRVKKTNYLFSLWRW